MDTHLSEQVTMLTSHLPFKFNSLLTNDVVIVFHKPIWGF